MTLLKENFSILMNKIWLVCISHLVWLFLKTDLLVTLLLLCFHADPSCCVKSLISPYSRHGLVLRVSHFSPFGWNSFKKTSSELIKPSELFSINRYKRSPFQWTVRFSFAWPLAACKVDSRNRCTQNRCIVKNTAPVDHVFIISKVVLPLNFV